MEKELKIKTAQDARNLVEASAQNNFEEALAAIKNQAQMGFSECVLYMRLSFEDVKKLMENGFTISEFLHPFEQRKLQKVGW